jgi:plasmid stabilization system protein ParE
LAADYLLRETIYLKSKNPAAAVGFVAAIRKAKQDLLDFPELGTEGVHLPVPGSRTWVSGDYLLDYARKDDLIVIVNIRHGRMKPETLPIDDDIEDLGKDPE